MDGRCQGKAECGKEWSTTYLGQAKAGQGGADQGIAWQGRAGKDKWLGVIG